MKADAVVVAGDMANDGRVAELLAVGKASFPSTPSAAAAVR